MKTATGFSVDEAMARARRIRGLREKCGLTQTALAAQSGAGVTTIFRIEQTGRIAPATAELLAPVLGVTPKDLLK